MEHNHQPPPSSSRPPVFTATLNQMMPPKEAAAAVTTALPWTDDWFQQMVRFRKQCFWECHDIKEKTQ